jgi:monomeric sarcosine oxidase
MSNGAHGVDVAVVGAGVFGAWIARCLKRAGRSVLLLDAWGPGHSRSSSGGESRIIRMGYGADEIYTRMALQSLSLWRELFEEVDQPLFHATGVLWIGRAGDAYSEATSVTLDKVGVPTEILSAADLAKRYPQMLLKDPRSFGIFEPESGALLARRATAAVHQDFIRRGGQYRAAFVQPPSGRGRLASLGTAGPERVTAGVYVFACGPWLPKLFPDLLGRCIYPTRQEVLFFAPPPGDRRFAPPELPVWIDFTDPRRAYGFPDLEARGFKLAFDRHGPAFDPDSGDRQLGSASVAEARAFLEERFPALADAPLTESRVCQYENTFTGDFLIDRHPDLENVWLVGGGSGHGFKHGPAVGAYVSARILSGGAEEPRFSLTSKGVQQARNVH